MFVLKRTYEAALDRAVDAEAQLRRLGRKWDRLVDEINAKGGQQFLDHGTINPRQQFTQDEIEKLLDLCHPDKHGGKRMAVEITQKLLKMREG